tara:strand:- start:399 stop:1241 length:843 start_codon:yes stop_codon:yes gene_type:complete
MKKYLSLIKFSHTIFAMPFALIGYFLAVKDYGFSIDILVKVLLCMIFARSSAMAFNRYIDRDIDKKNERTAKIREIPNGTILAKNALVFCIANILLFLITCYYINPLCFKLSPIAIIIILGYSLTKRFTVLCHFILGLGLSLAPIGGYLAISQEFKILPLLISLSVLLWVTGFDIIYSLQDEEFDKKEKLNSIPVMFGKINALRISKILHFFCATFFTLVGLIGKFGLLYWIGFTFFTFLLIYQHSIIKHDNLKNINLAFFTTNGIASIIFGCFFIFEIL